MITGVLFPYVAGGGIAMPATANPRPERSELCRSLLNSRAWIQGF